MEGVANRSRWREWQIDPDGGSIDQFISSFQFQPRPKFSGVRPGQPRPQPARAEWERHFKLKRDPRVTQVGRFLRATSLDELPQLLNILRGEMSLVGPRPIVADEVKRYGAAFHDYVRCRPGLTGMWQVSG